MTRFEYLVRRFAERPLRLPQAVRTSISRRLYPRYRASEVILRVGADGLALGDNLMLTTVAREIKKRNPRAEIQVVTNRADVFLRNPDIDSAIPMTPEARSQFHESLVTYKHGFPYKRHFVQYCCECVGIGGAIDLRTYVYPTPEDHAWAEALLSELPARPILVSRSAGSHAYRKTWPLESWKVLMAELSRHAAVVDIGAPGRPLAFPPGRYRSLLGKTSVHQLAALMQRSQALIGVDSGPIHLAPAVNLPTVCLLGGVYPAAAIRYPHSDILVSRPSCSDCAPLRHCHYNAQCLRDIKVHEVIAALDKLRDRTHRGTSSQRVSPIAAFAGTNVPSC